MWGVCGIKCYRGRERNRAAGRGWIPRQECWLLCSEMGRRFDKAISDERIIKMEIKTKTKIMFRIPFKWVAMMAYAILIVPILIFFMGWLKFYLAVLFSAILLIGAYFVMKRDYWNIRDEIEISICDLLFAVVVFAFWVFISGNCYTSFGEVDIIWRNAMLYDLVNYDWPVYYPDKNGYLCYYFVFWIVPAAFGKLFGGMLAAYIALACWIILILMTVFLLIAHYFKDYNRTLLRTIVIFMVMWSGINILGMFIMGHIGLFPNPPYFSTNEGYCDYLRWNFTGQPFDFLYRSNVDFMQSCYNQLPVWLIVSLMLQNRNVHSYAFLGLLLFPFSPWGTVGIALMMFVDAFALLIKSKSIFRLIREAWSVPNLCAVFSVFFVFYQFFAAENAYGSSLGFGIIKSEKFIPQILIGTLVFWACEFGIYYYLTWKKYRKDYLYVSVFVMLLIMPYIWGGTPSCRDFCMDATLPQLYFLMIYVIGYLKDELLSKKLSFEQKWNLRNCLLVVCLGLAFTTPVCSWINHLNRMITANKISIQDRSALTFADLLGYDGPFPAPVSTDVDECVFFKFLGKLVDNDQYRGLPISDTLSDIRNIDDVEEYLDYLKDKDCMVFVAVQDIQGYSLTPEILDKMKQLGFDENIDTLLEKEYHSFLGVTNHGQMIAEHVGGDEQITYYGEGVVDGGNVWMESGTLAHGNNSVINIQDGHYSARGRGLNIAVWDNTAKRVIDAVTFDTHTEEMACRRKAQ